MIYDFQISKEDIQAAAVSLGKDLSDELALGFEKYLNKPLIEKAIMYEGSLEKQIELMINEIANQLKIIPEFSKI